MNHAYGKAMPMKIWQCYDTSVSICFVKNIRLV